MLNDRGERDHAMLKRVMISDDLGLTVPHSRWTYQSWRLGQGMVDAPWLHPQLHIQAGCAGENS